MKKCEFLSLLVTGSKIYDEWRGALNAPLLFPVVDLRIGDQREPWPHTREEKAINKAHKLLLEGAKIIDNCRRCMNRLEGEKIVGPPKKQLRCTTNYFIES